MKNKIILAHDSIPPLVPFEIEVPDLCIITGLNGAGKSRLLQHLATGQIDYVCALNGTLQANDIVSVFDVARQDPFAGDELRRTDISHLCNLHGVDAMALIDRLQILRNRFRKESQSTAQDDAASARAADRKIFDAIQSYYSNDQYYPVTEESEGNELLLLLNEIDSCVTALSAVDCTIQKSDIAYLVIGHSLPDVGRRLNVTVKNPFSMEIHHHMQNWAQRSSRNLYDKFLEGLGTPNLTALDDREFEALHGKPPWDALDEQFKRLGLDVSVHLNKQAAKDRDQRIGDLQLEDSKGHLFTPSGLSSGERLLIKIALVRYVQSSDNFSYKKPKLVVFDEPDAHLHPSLAGQLIETLNDVFVSDGISVILSTHSPTTIALADEGTVITVERFATPRQVTRREAVNLLLSGQEKAFIDLTGTRLVFVEDESDAKLLEQLQALLRDRLTEATLVFRSLSKKGVSGSSNGGKNSVKKVIDQIGSGRNIFGLIDFDGTEQSTEDVIVLCEGERYSIENLLLDPRIVLHILLRSDAIKWAQELGLSATETNAGLLEEAELQNAVNQLHKCVFGVLPTETQKIEYLDGKILSVGKSWLLENGHSLRGKVINSLPGIAATPNKKDLLFHIVDQILLEQPDILPMSIVRTFEKVAKAE